MPYPLNLIPAMKRFDSGLFHAAAKEKSVSPPQNDVVISIVDEEGATDETQVTASDCGCCSAEEALDLRTVPK
uniref:Uncharacterized protein n=1 Tax=Panagrellus redivivus TaxID=6233 RepID=A0A7E4VCD0_PANRE